MILSRKVFLKSADTSHFIGSTDNDVLNLMCSHKKNLNKKNFKSKKFQKFFIKKIFFKKLKVFKKKFKLFFSTTHCNLLILEDEKRHKC
jgi:hypothetical protein